MVQELILKKSIQVKAPASKVWEALTNPELIKIYFFGTETKADWKVGGSIRFTGVWQGTPYVDKGTIVALEPGKLLQYKYWSSFSGKEDIPENYATITYLLEEQADQTLLTITQDGFQDREAYEHSDQNWESVLTQIKELIEKGK